MADKFPPVAGAKKQPQQQQTNVQDSLDKAKGLVEEARKMGFKVEDTDEFKGVIKDLQRERDRRQELENQRYSQPQQPDNQQQNNKKQVDGNQLLSKINSVDDGDLITGSQLKDIIGDLTSLVQNGFQTTAQVYTSERAADSEAKAKDRYSEDKVGKDLAYDNVIKNYYGEVIKSLGNPGLHQQIMNSKDPSEAAYRLALTHPDLTKKAEEAMKNRLSEDIQQNFRRTKKLGGAGGLINEIQMKQQTRDSLLARTSEDILAELQEDEA